MGDWADSDRLPGIVSIYVEGVDSEELILKLDGLGFARFRSERLLEWEYGCQPCAAGYGDPS